MQLRTVLLAAASLSATATAAWADQSGPGIEIGEIVVTGDPLGRSDREVISSVAVVRGPDLDHRRQATLGETLTGLPGVNSDTFGGGASRPVIRGQTAPRVKVLTDGAAIMDASEVSPDHAVSGEPLLLDGVEILRGPSALLYGGGAIGGAVNLIDKKIPTAIPDDGFEGVAEVRLGSADNERAAVVGATGGTGNFAIRLEAAGRRADDYEVPDWPQDTLDGSFNRSRTASLGLSWIGGQGYLGAAYTDQRSTYGLPGHSHEYEDCHPHGSSLHCGGHDHDHEHEHGEGDEHGAPIVELRSRRVDVRGEVRDPLAGIERIRLRGGYTDYAHDEIDDGVVATTFTNKGYDARIEAQHAQVGALRGVVGVQTPAAISPPSGRSRSFPRAARPTRRSSCSRNWSSAPGGSRGRCARSGRTPAPRVAWTPTTARSRPRRRPPGGWPRTMRSASRWRGRSARRAPRSCTPAASTWRPTPMRSGPRPWTSRPPTRSS